MNSNGKFKFSFTLWNLWKMGEIKRGIWGRVKNPSKKFINL